MQGLCFASDGKPAPVIAVASFSPVGWDIKADVQYNNETSAH
jgi:hypothetical protein